MNTTETCSHCGHIGTIGPGLGYELCWEETHQVAPYSYGRHVMRARCVDLTACWNRWDQKVEAPNAA